MGWVGDAYLLLFCETASMSPHLGSTTSEQVDKWFWLPWLLGPQSKHGRNVLYNSTGKDRAECTNVTCLHFVKFLI